MGDESVLEPSGDLDDEIVVLVLSDGFNRPAWHWLRP